MRAQVAVVVALLLSGCGEDLAKHQDCEVLIVGGGAGGLHTAFRLAPGMGDRVCLVEAEAELGGRIHDVPLDATRPDSPRFGAGARRIMETQTVLFNLATELGLTLEVPPNEADLIGARGRFAFAKDDLLPAYPKITAVPDTETALYDQLRKGSARAQANSFPDFRSYIRDVAGEEQYHFLRDVSRFRADFEYPLDARGYLDYLDEEWDVCCQPSYPVGGMSSFIRGMEARAAAAGVRIFKSEPVTAIEPDSGRYKVTTKGMTLVASKLVMAIPPVALAKITGSVSDRLQKLPQLQAIIAVPVVTVAQWWPDRWWANVVNPGATADNHVWRAWTTDHCLNFIEIPLDQYGVDQKATRSVYDDDANCVAFWSDIAKQGIDKVEAEIQRGLEYLFNDNGLTAKVTIPKPIKTHFQYWPAAWHWLRASAGYTNQQIFDWAVEPLAGEPVALVGEAYNPQRSGWSDAAYKSSIKLLSSKYGITVPQALSLSPRGTRTSRSQAGH
jgi:hypothetical protein